MHIQQRYLLRFDALLFKKWWSDSCQSAERICRQLWGFFSIGGSTSAQWERQRTGGSFSLSTVRVIKWQWRDRVKYSTFWQKSGCYIRKCFYKQISAIRKTAFSSLYSQTEVISAGSWFWESYMLSLHPAWTAVTLCMRASISHLCIDSSWCRMPLLGLYLTQRNMVTQHQFQPQSVGFLSVSGLILRFYCCFLRFYKAWHHLIYLICWMYRPLSRPWAQQIRWRCS